MTRRSGIGVLLCMTLGLASIVSAQSVPLQIRVLTASGAGNRRWQGYIAELTTDSLRLRVGGTDSTVALSRSVIRSVEREHPDQSGRAAGIGRLAVGGALGGLGYFSHGDGLEKPVGVLAFVVGCLVGGAGGTCG